MCVRIANSRGIPGTLGCLARTVHQQRSVFLTSCHVLFAGGATRRDPVWRVQETAGRRDFQRLGSALQGKRGIVRFRGDDYYVDCAIGSLDQDSKPAAALAALSAQSVATAKRGDRVFKTGAATGTTAGIVVDTSYYGSDATAGTSLRDATPRQLLIRRPRTRASHSPRRATPAR